MHERVLQDARAIFRQNIRFIKMIRHAFHQQGQRVRALHVGKFHFAGLHGHVREIAAHVRRRRERVGK